MHSPPSSWRRVPARRTRHPRAYVPPAASPSGSQGPQRRRWSLCWSPVHPGRRVSREGVRQTHETVNDIIIFEASNGWKLYSFKIIMKFFHLISRYGPALNPLLHCPSPGILKWHRGAAPAWLGRRLKRPHQLLMVIGCAVVMPIGKVSKMGVGSWGVLNAGYAV